MSTGLGFSTILGCLGSGEQVAHLRPEAWTAEGGAEQRFFASVQLGWRPGLSQFDAESLRSYATTDHGSLTAKMLEWKMRLDPIPQGGRGAVYMISQLREYLQWLVAGKRMLRQGVNEFVLNEGVQLLSVGDRNNFLVQVGTKNGDTVTCIDARRIWVMDSGF